MSFLYVGTCRLSDSLIGIDVRQAIILLFVLLRLHCQCYVGCMCQMDVLVKAIPAEVFAGSGDKAVLLTGYC